MPNKEFITGRLLNWTLSDPVNRVVVNVGVAYGSDTKLARELLLQVAAQNEFVMKDPSPLATFEGFGDSTLNFVLRAYLPNLDNRLSVINTLHTDIDQAFRAHNIEIAFPQRDIHVRTMPVKPQQIMLDELERPYEPKKEEAVQPQEEVVVEKTHKGVVVD